MLQSAGRRLSWGLQSSICPSMELIGTLDHCYIKVCVLIILYALLPFGAPTGAPHLVAPAPIALSHQNRSPPKIGPPDRFWQKSCQKWSPPDQFWLPQSPRTDFAAKNSLPLPKKQIWQTYACQNRSHKQN